MVIQRPGSQPDSLKAVVAGRADVGVPGRSSIASPAT
jgi:hypothetical protein